jgi:chromosome segregation ATPase
MKVIYKPKKKKKKKKKKSTTSAHYVLLVANLKSQIKEYETKLKEQHGQLVNFQKKLAQAGNHLKTLAQENANLTKSVAEEIKSKDNVLKERTELETMRHDENTTWSTKVQALEQALASSKEGHQQEIKQLVDILESTAKSIDIEKEETVVPDVSTSTLLDSYMKSVQKRLIKSTEAVKKQPVVKSKIM